MHPAIAHVLCRIEAERMMVASLSDLAIHVDAALSALPGYHHLAILHGIDAHPIIVVHVLTDRAADIDTAEATLLALGLERQHAEGHRDGSWPAWVISFAGVRLHIGERTRGSLFDPMSVGVVLR